MLWALSTSVSLPRLYSPPGLGAFLWKSRSLQKLLALFTLFSLPHLSIVHWTGRGLLGVPRFGEPVGIAYSHQPHASPLIPRLRKLRTLSIPVPLPRPGAAHRTEHLPVGVAIPFFAEPGGIIYVGVIYLRLAYRASLPRWAVCAR